MSALQQLSGHVAVFMQGMMDEEGEEVRFRDTIGIIKRGEGGRRERKRPLHMH